jgi:allantoinase
VDTLQSLLDAGVLGVKSFMVDSGIPEFQPVSPQDLIKAMTILKKNNLPYLFHAERDRAPNPNIKQGPDYQSFLKSRPDQWEVEAIEEVIQALQKVGGRAHIVHLSSSHALEKIRKAKAQGLHLTVETCPHYLLLNDQTEKVFSPQNQKTLLKCCPPIRDEKNRELLWMAS